MPRPGLVIAALLVLYVGVAHAAEPDLADAARAHYLAGSEEYRRGDYGEALTEFQKSYELSGRPELLFNIGMCQAKRGLWREAERFLRRFLATNPGQADRVEAEAQIQRLERLQKLEEFERLEAERNAKLAQRRELEAQRRELEAQRRELEARRDAPATPPQGSFARRHMGSLIAGGAGVTALLIMSATAVAAEGAFSNAACDQASHLCDSRDSLDSAQRLAITSDVLLGIGVTAGATAIMLAILESRRPRLLGIKPTVAGLRVEF